MKRAIQKNAKWVATIVALMAAGFAVLVVILLNQGVRLPWEEKVVRIEAVLDNAQAVTPGQGQAVQVSGVEIGKIATVDLEDGRAVVGLDIEPQYVDEGLIRTDARALLRPRTPLKDMYVQVLPGSMERPAAGEGFRIPIDRTASDVDFDELLSSLDQRTTDYLQLLLEGTGDGLAGRGEDLAEVFERFKPTMKDLARVNKAVAAERRDLKRLTSSLASLTGRLAEKPEDLTQLVSSAEATFSALGAESDSVRSTVAELPATLRQATATLRDVRPLADELGPATEALTPAMRALARANRAIRPAARTTEPLVRTQIRPFVRAARPVVQDLAPAAGGLARTFPEITGAGKVLNRFFNMLAFNPDGAEPKEKKGREEGFLYWLAWTAHNGANLINVDDANGPLRPIFLTAPCATFVSLVNDFPELEFLAGLAPVIGGACGQANARTASVDVKKALKARGMAKEGK